MHMNEIIPYKSFGTVQLTKNEDGDKCYVYNHTFFNRPGEEFTIREAKEMLDFYERKAQEIRAAIRVLGEAGYKVYKEIA